MKYKPFIPLLTSLLVLLLAEIFLAHPQFFYISLTLSLLLVILSVKYISNKSGKHWLLFIIPPTLFLFSFFFYSAMAVSNLLIQGIYLLITGFVFVYLRDFYYYSSQIKQEIDWSAKLDNLLLSGGFLIAFSSSAVLFNLSAFITWPLYLMLPVWAVIAYLLLIQFKPFKTTDSWTSNSLILVAVLILTELAGAFSLLPLDFNILALLLAIIYNLILMIIRLDSSHSLNRRTIKIPLILTVIMILLLFITARWL